MTSILWLRQDLRISDQPALVAATGEGPVIPLYVLDDETPGDDRIGAAQRWWLHHSLAALGVTLEGLGAPLVLRRGRAGAEIARVAEEAGVTRVHAIRHYEPWWKTADAEVGQRLDLVLHDGGRLVPPERVRTAQGGRYRMFTPYRRALQQQMPPPPPVAAPAHIACADVAVTSERLEDWGLLPTRPNWAEGFAVWTPGEAGAAEALESFLPGVAGYDVGRNRPSLEGTSRLSAHLHFGEISPATLWHVAQHAEAQPYLRELAWRDFTANVIDQFPDYGHRNGRRTFDGFPWRMGAGAEADFVAWTRGRTGYPIVDAGMRELWATGWMHNRVRMIAASFLVKHLLIDWRRGATWFWDTLVDADYGNNAVNWQWIAGSGIDSNPFGRIMAPLAQSAKFDAGEYIRQWVPELGDVSAQQIHDPEDVPGYPTKLIGHREARARALAAAARLRSDPAALA